MSDHELTFVRYDAQLQISDDPASAVEVANSIVDALQQKGFCVLNAKPMIDTLAEGHGLLKAAEKEVVELEECGSFERPPHQAAEGLLGEEGSLAVCQLDNDDEDGGQARSLLKLDSILGTVAALIQPVAESHLGLNIGGRSAPMLHLAGDVDEEDEAPSLTESEAEKWLSVFVNQRLLLLLFLGPGKGHLKLQPFHHQDSPHFVVSTDVGTVVVLRSDTLTQTFQSYERSTVLTSGLAQTVLDEERPDIGNAEKLLPPAARQLMEWISGRMKVLKEREITTSDGAKYDVDLSREWQCAMNHTYIKGTQCAIRGMSCRFAGTWDPYSSCAGLTYGSDMATEIPITRWKHEDVYNPEPDSWKFFKVYAKHGTFIEGGDLFDPKPFGLAVYEAKGMDPCQRHILETSYESLLNAGFGKKSLMRSLIGVYIGAAQTEFGMAENCNEGVGTSCAGAITSNRISFCLGLQGPSYTTDLGAAASLGSLLMAVNSIRFQTKLYISNHTAVAGGVNLLLASQYYVLACSAGFLSLNGRSQSFDTSANGYLRGEGIADVVVSQFSEVVDGVAVRDETRPFHGNIASTTMSQNGRSANLTAPNGPQESALIAEAVRQASLSPLDVDALECWGEGGLLADAVSTKAANDALRENDTSTVLGLSSVQSNLGYMQESLGMAQLFKVIFSNKHNTQMPGIHISELNPHIFAWEGEPLNFHTEAVHYKHVSAFAGVTSKSSSGTLVHAIEWGEVDYNRFHPRQRIQRDAIAFWPAGGGELPEGAEPRRGYTIIGSWTGSEWTNPESMKLEGDGVYGYTITLGESGSERFQIWLDGNDQNVLHPGMAYAPKNVPVQGPSTSEDSDGFSWIIDGHEQVVSSTTPALMGPDGGADAGDSVGVPGDRYHVQLHIAGKWRTVDWKLVETKNKKDKM